MRRTLALAFAGALCACQPLLAITAKVTAFSGELAYRLGEGEWTDAQNGQELKPEMELCTGPGSEATIGFSDGSAVKLKEMSQLRVGELLSAENRVKVEMLLRTGDVEAQVNPKKVAGTDFSVTTPNATASVKGTTVKVSFHRQTGTTTQLVTGKVLVNSDAGEVAASPGDTTKVDAENSLVPPSQVVQQDSRLVTGSTELVSEETGILQDSGTTNPNPDLIPGESSVGGSTQSGGTADDATLLLRFEIR